MHFHSFIALITLALAYTFEFVNGFHDTANAVATVIYTKALRAPVAIIMSGFCNFLGCLLTGTAVALVITEVIPRGGISLHIILAVLVGSLIWNLYTWYHGIPVSSSHCLIGALFGAGVAAGGWSGVVWERLIPVMIALLLSPDLGFCSRGGRYRHSQQPGQEICSKQRNRAAGVYALDAGNVFSST